MGDVADVGGVDLLGLQKNDRFNEFDICLAVDFLKTTRLKLETRKKSKSFNFTTTKAKSFWYIYSFSCFINQNESTVFCSVISLSDQK